MFREEFDGTSKGKKVSSRRCVQPDEAKPVSGQTCLIETAMAGLVLAFERGEKTGNPWIGTAALEMVGNKIMEAFPRIGMPGRCTRGFRRNDWSALTVRMRIGPRPNGGTVAKQEPHSVCHMQG